MVFGEIVEPSTRALIIDEEEEFMSYPPDYSFRLAWEGTAAVPDTINSLTFVESVPLIRLLNKVLHGNKIYAELKSAGVKVYGLENHDFLVQSNVPEGITFGEVVQNFAPWLEKAQNVYCITSKPIPLYINLGASESSETFIRSLVNKDPMHLTYNRLESPNLVSGLGAGIMSFCVYKNKACALFVAYICSAPLDSVTARPIIELLSKLNIYKGEYKIGVDTPSSNLYM